MSWLIELLTDLIELGVAAFEVWYIVRARKPRRLSRVMDEQKQLQMPKFSIADVKQILQILLSLVEAYEQSQNQPSQDESTLKAVDE